MMERVKHNSPLTKPVKRCPPGVVPTWAAVDWQRPVADTLGRVSLGGMEGPPALMDLMDLMDLLDDPSFGTRSCKDVAQ